MDLCQKVIQKPEVYEARFERVLRDHVYSLQGAYSMND